VAVGASDGLDPRQIRERTDGRFAGLPLEAAVENLNPVLRGWSTYFRYGNFGRKFDAIDHYVNQRPRCWSAQARAARMAMGDPLHTGVGPEPLRRSLQRDGAPDHCACRSANDFGEPCAGEPHARFEGAGGDPVPLAARPKGPASLPLPEKAALCYIVANSTG